MAKTLLVKAEIFKHLGDHQTAKAILEAAGTPVRGCTDAGITSTLLASAEANAAAVTSRNEGCAVDEELTPQRTSGFFACSPPGYRDLASPIAVRCRHPARCGPSWILASENASR